MSYTSYEPAAMLGHCYLRETPLPIHTGTNRDGASALPPEELLRIRTILRKLTATRIPNSEDAEDLVQDTLLTMTMKPPEGGLRKGFLVWSMGILRRKVGNYYKKSQRYAATNHEKEIAWQAGRLSNHSSSPERVVQHAELRALIQHIMTGFPLSEQEALNLLLAGLPPHEIAEELSTERYQNVINRIHRGRKKLAKALRRHGY